MPRAVLAHLVPGQLETGLWCESCGLPSVIRVRLYLVGDEGVQQVAIAEACVEEQQEDDE